VSSVLARWLPVGAIMPRVTVLSKGANVPVPSPSVHAVLSWSTGPGIPDVDASALLLTASGKVRSDADFVFYNQAKHGSGAVEQLGKNNGTDTIAVHLGQVEAAVTKVVIAASADGGTFGQVPGLCLRVFDAASRQEILRFEDMQASSETAFVAGEFYRRDGAWKFRAVGQGWASGLAGLAQDYGISVDEEPAPAPAPAFAPPPPFAPPAPQPGGPTTTHAPVGAPSPIPGIPGFDFNTDKRTLTKQDPAYSMNTPGVTAGHLRVNLNWNTSGPRPVDLDLGCLYEYNDGSAGALQAVGGDFTDYHSFGPSPIAWLDGDDRTGSVAGGENMYIDLRYMQAIKRILVYAYIYEGVPNWAAANGVVTLFPLAGPQVEVRLDEVDERSRMCAIALLTNVHGQLVVERQVTYIRGGGQRLMSEMFGWDLEWAPGSK
jgi:tellurite resistance protein TerA